MEYLHTCLNFFDECYQFKERYRKFENACQNLSFEDYEDMDHDILKEAIWTFVQVKQDLSELCHLKLCKHEFDAYSDGDMDEDMSDSNDESYDDTDDDSEGDTEKDSEDCIDDSQDSVNEGTSTEEDGSILFRSDECCWDKIMTPFYNAIKNKKTAEVMLRTAEDKMEDQYERLDKCFATNEKTFCAKLLQEICNKYDTEGYKFIKNCSSPHVKLLSSYCKDIIKVDVLEEIFGDNYKLLIDENVPLNKKRKIFKDNKNLDQLINYVKENTLPQVNQFINDKKQQFLEKHT